MGLSDTSVGDESSDDTHSRLIARPDSFGQEHLPLVSQTDDILRLLRVGHKRLFHKTGLACQYGLACYVVMVRVRSADIYKVDVLVGNQLAVRTIRLLDVTLGSKGRCRFLFA